MKIAVLSSHTPSLFWFRMDMMQDFIRLGHTVIAVGNEEAEKWKDKFKGKNIKYIQADISRNGTNPLSDIKTLFSLKKILRQEAPDKIFTYQAKTVIYGSLAAASIGIKEIYPLIAGCGSVFLSKGAKAMLLQKVMSTEYRIALKKSKKVFFQNSDDVKLFKDLKMVEPQKTVMLNGSGVNLDKFTPLPFPHDFAFLCISRLIRDKGVLEYMQAAELVKKKYPQVRFLLVGPYDSNPSALKKEEVEGYIDKGIIEYFGEQANVIPYLEQCNVFVLPSYREGTPKTVLEAMASQRAVITTDAPGCRETVKNGANGFLVPVKDVGALASKMIYLINNPDVAEKMGSEGRKTAEEKFDVKIVNKKIIEVMDLRSFSYEFV